MLSWLKRIVRRAYEGAKRLVQKVHGVVERVSAGARELGDAATLTVAGAVAGRTVIQMVGYTAFGLTGAASGMGFHAVLFGTLAGGLAGLALYGLMVALFFAVKAGTDHPKEIYIGSY